MILKLAVAFLAALSLATGGYFVVKEEGFRSLTSAMTERLASGDYLAALAVAGKLKEGGDITPELEETISQAARLLVAEDIFKKAKKAAGEERWQDAQALLASSDAVLDPSFKHYREAKELLLEAEALAASKAHQTAITIHALQTEAKQEKQKRSEAEQNRKSLEKTLTEKDTAIAKTKAEALQSKKEAELTQAQLTLEQARAKQLMEQIEKESKSKFFTELRTYRDMAQKGREQLDNAMIEIQAKRDVTALVYLSQGKILFEEAKQKTAELRSSRTPTSYQARVDDLVKAFEQFLESVRQLRNAIVYIEEQGSIEFTSGLGKGTTALSNAVTNLSAVF